MKILITGSSGMLGIALCEELASKYEISGLDVKKPITNYQLPITNIKCDISDSEKAIASIISVKPDIVIHAAAYTDVDGCELNPERAYKVNSQGTKNVAEAAQGVKAFLIYISTDYVFDGQKPSAYQEQDKPNPINVYGRTKYEGEQFVKDTLNKYLIIRSSWLFGTGGKNFVDSVLQEIKTDKALKVVDDQFGSPTYTKDLAQAMGRLIGLTESLSSIYHITNSGSCSWYEFAKEVLKILDSKKEVSPISSEESNRPAKRPRISILDNRKYKDTFGRTLRPWKEAIKDYLSCKSQI